MSLHLGLRGPLLGALLIALSSGCPDPNPISSYEDVTGTAPGSTTTPAPTDQGATQPNDARFRVKPGEGVKVGGVFVYDGTRTGMRRLDFRQVPDDGSPPRLVHTLELRESGPWSIEAPKDFGALQIHAFIDQAGDGPTTGDPGYLTDPPVVIGQEPIESLTLTLTDDFDPAALSPGGAPGGLKAVQGDPSGAAPMGEGSAPPTGPAPGPGEAAGGAAGAPPSTPATPPSGG